MIQPLHPHLHSLFFFSCSYTYGGSNNESYQLTAHKRHPPLYNPSGLLNPSSPGSGIHSSSNCNTASPSPSLADPYSDPDDMEDRKYNEIPQIGVTTGTEEIISHSLPGCSGLSKMYGGQDKLRTTSATGLVMRSEYDTLSERLEHTPYGTRASAACGRANTISGTRINRRDCSILGTRDEFRLADDKRDKQRQSISTIRNFKSPGSIQTSLRNYHNSNVNHDNSLNYKTTCFDLDGPGGPCGLLADGLRPSSCRGRNRAHSLVNTVHVRDERKMLPTPKRENVKKTRKQVSKITHFCYISTILVW